MQAEPERADRGQYVDAARLPGCGADSDERGEHGRVDPVELGARGSDPVGQVAGDPTGGQRSQAGQERRDQVPAACPGRADSGAQELAELAGAPAEPRDYQPASVQGGDLEVVTRPLSGYLTKERVRHLFWIAEVRHRNQGVVVQVQRSVHAVERSGKPLRSPDAHQQQGLDEIFGPGLDKVCQHLTVQPTQALQ